MKNCVKLTVSLLVISILAGCGGSASYLDKGYDAYYETTTESMPSYDYNDNGYYPEESYEPGSTAEKVEVADTSRKLIKDYSINVETENFDALMPAIEQRVASLGGYIESMNTYYGRTYRYSDTRYSDLKIRIPKDKDEEFIKYVGNSANITNQSLNVSDVTLRYVDMASRRDSYIVERDRLLSLLEQAEDINEILIIEERLSEVRYNLESMESQLRTMDNLVDYSTISLSVAEVKQYTEPEPETYGQRISASFHDGIYRFVEGIKNFTIWLAGSFLTLILWAVLITFAVWAVSKIRKRKGKTDRKVKKNKKASSENKTEEPVENDSNNQ